MDSRLEWMMRQVRSHFRIANYDSSGFASGEEAITDFLDGPVIRALWFSEVGRGVLAVTAKPPAITPNSKGRGFSFLYMIKTSASPIDRGNSN